MPFREPSFLSRARAGLAFCTDHNVHATWKRQVKRVMQWLLRFFFACTIGFEIPLRELGQTGTLTRAGMLLPCMAGKLAMGAFHPPPATCEGFWTLAWAWGEWGEYSFLIATVAVRGEIITQQEYDGVLLALLVSVVACPWALRYTLREAERRAEEVITDAIVETTDGLLDGQLHPAFYCVQTRSHAHFDQQTLLLRALTAAQCRIIDFRSFHPNDHLGAAHAVNEV